MTKKKTAVGVWVEVGAHSRVYFLCLLEKMPLSL
jgi:hypothetical protein